MTETVAFAIALMGALYLIVASFLSDQRARRYERLAFTERTRSQWAEARELLFSLVRDERLNPRSETFRTLYSLQTFVLRRPDAYEAIADELQNQLLRATKGGEPPWFAERSTWPEEMNDVLAKMAHGVGMLAFGYPGLGGKILRALVRITPHVAIHMLRSVLGRLKKAALAFRSVRVEKKFIEAERQLLSLTAQPASFAQTLRPAHA